MNNLANLRLHAGKLDCILVYSVHIPFLLSHHLNCLITNCHLSSSPPSLTDFSDFITDLSLFITVSRYILFVVMGRTKQVPKKVPKKQDKGPLKVLLKKVNNSRTQRSEGRQHFCPYLVYQERNKNYASVYYR